MVDSTTLNAIDVDRWSVDGSVFTISERYQPLDQSAHSYVATRSSGGWRKSAAVFGKAFRLTRQLDDLGHPDFTLEVK